MTDSITHPKASVIISVYKGVDELRCILWALERQSEKNIEIIKTDGELEINLP